MKTLSIDETKQKIKQWNECRPHFEADLEKAVLCDLLLGVITPEEIYSSVTNIEWLGPEGKASMLSFRQAGGMIARFLGKGDYMDWYCCANSGVVFPVIEMRMGVLGWTWESV